MSRRPWARLLCVPLSALALGCGDAGPELGELSQAEAGSLLVALSAVWFPSPSAPSPAAPGPFLIPETTLIQDTTDVDVACNAGGTASVLSIDSISVTVDARINPTPDTTWASNTDYGGSSTTTVDYAACRATGSQGDTWTFDAAPGLTFSYDIEGTIDSYALTNQAAVISTTVSWSGLWSGSFNWSNGSRSGSCTISLTSMSMTSNIQGQISSAFSQDGQICGVDISTGS